MKRSLETQLETVFHEGYHYTTLDLVGPDDSCYSALTASQMKHWRKLLPGWEIALYSETVVKHVIAAYSWSCDGILVRKPLNPQGTNSVVPSITLPNMSNLMKAYGTSKSSTPGQVVSPVGIEWLEERNGLYRVDISAKYRILIRKKVERPTEKPDSLGERLWKKQRYTDFVIVCGAERIPCHRAVLAEASTVFEAALTPEMREGREGQLEIKDAEPSVIKSMVAYMYTKVLNAQHGDLPALLRLADQYDMQLLLKEAASRMEEHLDASNVVEVCQLLKPVKDSPSLQPVWASLRARIKSDDKLIDALIP